MKALNFIFNTVPMVIGCALVLGAPISLMAFIVYRASLQAQ